MNKEIEEFIKDLKEKLNKKLENYELDKAFGQLSPESIYSLFPNESKLLLDYINQLETNRDEAIELVKEIKLHYQQHPAMIPSVKIDKLLSLLERGKEC